MLNSRPKDSCHLELVDKARMQSSDWWNGIKDIWTFTFTLGSYAAQCRGKNFSSVQCTNRHTKILHKDVQHQEQPDT